jgi:hypothetical protein
MAIILTDNQMGEITTILDNDPLQPWFSVYSNYIQIDGETSLETLLAISDKLMQWSKKEEPVEYIRMPRKQFEKLLADLTGIINQQIGNIKRD